MIAVMAAMECEVEEFLRHSTIIADTRWGESHCYQLQLLNHRIVLVRSGVGKVMSAMVTQRLIDQFTPRAIILTGLAGALNAKLEIGDVVIAKDTIQHDLDATPLGFSRGTVPYTNYSVLECDPRLLGLASGAKLQNHSLHLGRILTGDQFLTHADANSHRYLIEELKGDAIEMEGAAVALVATINAVPFLIVRTISDRADGAASESFASFLPLASKNSFAVVSHLLSHPGLASVQG